MDDKIYNTYSKEYVSYGHYKFDNEDYYSIEQYRKEFLFEECTREENQEHSDALNKYRDCKSYKTKPERGRYEFIRVYKEDLLEEYFRE